MKIKYKIVAFIFASVCFSCERKNTNDEVQLTNGGAQAVSVSNKLTLNEGDCVDPDLSKISNDVSFTACDGSLVSGTASICENDGDRDCFVNNDMRAADPTNISVWDLQYGKQLAGVSGARKRCRNAFGSNAHYNYDDAGGIGSIGNVDRNDTDNVDWWDTTDDLWGTSWTFAASLDGTSDAWGDEFYCNGASMSDVSNSSPDLAPTNSAICSGCDSSRNFTQIWYDAVTNLYFTNELSSNSDWDEAIIECNALTSGTGLGADNWRVPTSKELHELAINGVSFHQASYDGNFHDFDFWSATTAGEDGQQNRAMTVNLSSNWSQAQEKVSTYQYKILCVRDGP